MLNTEQNKAYAEFAQTIPGKELDAKTNYLVRAATAIAVGCYP